MLSARDRSRVVLTLALLIATLISSLTIGAARLARAQEATPTGLSCTPAVPAAPATTAGEAATPIPASGELVEVKMGFVPVSIFAPVFIAKEKGYFAEQGLDVTLEPFPGGSDPLVLTASGQLDLGIGGAGPAFWNAIAQGLPIEVIAPGHQEGDPVATPLMISTASCESGTIASVADLKGKKVSVNARGATEYWLAQALATGGLTLDDIDLQTLAFPDAVAALASGAVDAAMVGEPLATSAEQQGIAVRLASSFDIQGVQPTVIFANSEWTTDHPAAAAGLVTAYLKACRELTDGGFADPATLAIIEQYTGVPADLVAQAVKPVYAVDGQINIEGLATLQAFFRERGQLEYDDDIDPATIVDTQFVDAALATLGAYEDGA